MFVAIAGFDLETRECSSALGSGTLAGAPLLFSSPRQATGPGDPG